MHELGHSIGFRHSGYAGNEYADESGYMVSTAAASVEAPSCTGLINSHVFLLHHVINRVMLSSKYRCCCGSLLRQSCFRYASADTSTTPFDFAVSLDIL